MKLKKHRHFIDDEKDERRYLETRFILDVTHALAIAIDAKGSRQAAAAEIDMKPQQLSDLLSGDANMTLRTFASLAYAADCFPITRLVPIASLDQSKDAAFNLMSARLSFDPITPLRVDWPVGPVIASATRIDTFQISRIDEWCTQRMDPDDCEPLADYTEREGAAA